MKRLVFAIFFSSVTLLTYACDVEDATVTPQPVCVVNEDCADQNPCTQDLCDTESGFCVHPAVDCSDNNACTADTCDPATGECGHTDLTCNDGNQCTIDSCDPDDSGCKNTAKVCEDDGDKCTIETCDPTDGSCGAIAKSCDDNNECTTDSCDSATGNCSSVAVANGTPCSMGEDFVDGEFCLNGVCTSSSPADRGMFRVDSLTFNSPTLTFDLGAGEEEINDVISAFLTAYLDDFEYGGMVAFIDPAIVGHPDSSARFGEGVCAFDDEVASSCAVVPWGNQATFESIAWTQTGNCVDAPAVAAPCFKTPEGTFDVHAIAPAIFPADAGTVVGWASATIDTDLANGVIRAFIPETILTSLKATLGDRTITGTDLVANLTAETYGNHTGYWVELGWTAKRVAVLELTGCALDTSICDDLSPCTLDECNPLSGTCEHPAGNNGTACDDGYDFTTNDVCSAGTCVGTVTSTPRVFRVSSVTLTQPDVQFDFGSGAESINAVVGALLTAELDKFNGGLGGLVFTFNTLLANFPATTLTFGEGECSKDSNIYNACKLATDGDSAAFDKVTVLASGTCGGDFAIAGPCFETPTKTFDLASIVSGYFDGAVDSVTGWVAGTILMTDSQMDQIANGTIHAFVPRTAIPDVSFEYGGNSYTPTDLLANTPAETIDGVEGWWVTMGFDATEVSLLQ